MQLSLSADALMWNAVKQSASWKNAILFLLRGVMRSSSGEIDEYELVGESLLVGLYVLVFARQSLLPDISDVTCSYVGAGLLGKLGNKGAVGVRLRLGVKSVCFVCAHLAAHQEEVRRRNADWAVIDTRLFGENLVSEHGINCLFFSI